MTNYSFSKKNNKKKPIISDINVTPFVDILLVLLIIFMVAAPMLNSEVNLNLPQGSKTALKQKKQPIFVSITANGTIFLGKKAVKSYNIANNLKKLTNNNFNSKIYIRADKSLDYGKVMQVVKIINLAGFSKISLATKIAQ